MVLMFGYVVAERSSMQPEELSRYQGCYCGICRAIGTAYGTLQRAALNYDMTFLVLLLSSLYEPEECSGPFRCAIHPLKPRTSWQNSATDYGAAMNMVLAYHNCMDDWQDDRKLPALLESKLFHKAVQEAQQRYPRQCAAINQCINDLRRLEAEDLQEPDAGAGVFGQMMAELFVWKEDRWEPLLRQMGSSLGRYIYLTDAILDLPQDLKNGAYNPFSSRAAQGVNREQVYPILKILMGECTEALERLPLVQDLSLIRNILYAGVWTRFYQQDRRPGKEEHHV